MRAFMAFLLASGLCAAGDDFDRLMKQGREAFLKSDFATAAETYRKACAPELLNTYTASRLASCEHHLATTDAASGHAAQAEERYRRALDEWEKAGAFYRVSSVITLMNLGELHRREHRPAEAAKAMIQAVDIAREIDKQFPQAYPEALSRLGGLYAESEQPERGRALLIDAIDRFGNLATPEPAELGYAHNALGMVELAASSYKAAESNLREAVTLATSSLGEDHAETATYQMDLALALLQEGQFERAETLLRRARFVMEARLGPSSPRVGTVLVELSAAALGQGKRGIAEEYGQQAVSVIGRQPVVQPADLALANVNLATVYMREGRTREAEKILPEAVATERQVAPKSRLLADGLRRLAELRATQRSWRESAALYKEAIAIYEVKLGPNSQELAPVMRACADVLRHDPDSKEAAKAFESRAKAILSFGPTD